MIEPKVDGSHALWHQVALCYGYNELARQAQTLGEKVYFRLFVDDAEKSAIALGAKLELTRETPVLTLPYAMPHIRSRRRTLN